MNVRVGLRRSVTLISLIVLLTLSTSALSASIEKLPQEKNDANPIDLLFYLDTIDELTVDLAMCEEALELKEKPPECDGKFPWLWVVGSLFAGYVINDVVN